MMCPGCGAPMKLDTGKDFLACEYCGTTHFPDPNPDGVRVLDEPSDEQCPRCSVALVQAAIAGERVLYCQRCHGLLIGMDVFLAVVEDMRSRHSSSEYAGVQPELGRARPAHQVPQVREGDGHASVWRTGECDHRYLRELCAELAGLRGIATHCAGAG